VELELADLCFYDFYNYKNSMLGSSPIAYVGRFLSHTLTPLSTSKCGLGVMSVCSSCWKEHGKLGLKQQLHSLPVLEASDHDPQMWFLGLAFL
jgi:hypothetical protein